MIRIQILPIWKFQTVSRLFTKWKRAASRFLECRSTPLKRLTPKLWSLWRVLLSAKSHIMNLIQASKYCVVFTGAGISTAANVPDFRGPGGLNSKGILGLKEHELDVIMPTMSHLIIKHLIDKEIFKFVVTSNHDDLHTKAGTNPGKIAELFGNAYVEKCVKCGTPYRRSVVTPSLGRKCDNSICGGKLIKTGVRFGGSVPEEPLLLATEHAKKCDLAIILGSSMTVSPFCDLAALADKLVVVSIQKTPVDKLAKTLKFNAKCDDVMRQVASRLNINVPNFVYRASFFVKASRHGLNEIFCTIFAKSNEPVNCIDSAEVLYGDGGRSELDKVGLIHTKTIIDKSNLTQVTFRFRFQSEYGEPEQDFIAPIDGEAHEYVFEHHVSYL